MNPSCARGPGDLSSIATNCSRRATNVIRLGKRGSKGGPGMLTLEDGVRVLSDELKNGRLIAFVGSGISVESNLPTWDGFLDSFITFCRDVKKEYGPRPSDAIHLALPDHLLTNATEERAKRPAHVAWVLKEALAKAP